MGMSKTFTNYLHKQKSKEKLIFTPPVERLQLIVIIPAFNEPDILHTLISLLECHPAAAPTEVIILINQSESAPKNIHQINIETHSKVIKWIAENSTKQLKFHCIFKDNLPIKNAGAGLARKIAMDEAINRYNQIGNENGIIASLDADTRVSKNYIAEIQSHFHNEPNLNCATLGFKHHIPQELSLKNKEAIILYELHLRYFKQALKFTGFPYSFHTIGSCFAVKALTYAKQGGMNSRKAGEDFYFLHKVFPLEGTSELNQITVFPSSRISDRVPFGTGPALQKIIENGYFLSYRFETFLPIKKIISSIDSLFKANENSILKIYSEIHDDVKESLSKEEFLNSITEINTNSASLQTFKKRFFDWFSAFRIIKILNKTALLNSRISITESALELAKTYPNFSLELNSAANILEFYRNLESVNYDKENTILLLPQ